jgi:transcriptional regulator with XRE-family HTH domain
MSATSALVPALDPAALAAGLASLETRLADVARPRPDDVAAARAAAERVLERDAREVARAGIEAGRWIDLQRAAHGAAPAARAGGAPAAQRRALRIGVEGMRFLLERIAERELLGDDRPAREIAAWLEDALAVSQSEKAELLGVSLRTYQRWLAGEAAPSGEDERRLRLLARLVLDVRGLLGGPGVAGWLRDPDRALGGRSPLEIVAEGDPRRLARLLELSGAARAGAGG